MFIPLEYKPGDLGEVDFFEVEVDLDGVRTTAFLFVMRLMSSGRDFCWVYPRQDQTCFLDGHVRAFAHFDGVNVRCAYDNLKAAVLRHLVGSERVLTPRMLALTTHYVFEACFCRPYEGHDEGGVEARGKNIRLQSMVPVPSGVTLDDISKSVLADVEKRFWAKADAAAGWQSEHGLMHDAPRRPYDPRKTEVSVPVSSRAEVVVEGSTYSVPSRWARLSVTTHAGVSEVELVGPGGVSEVRRRIPKGGRDIDYARHYLEELSKKPQAVRQVADTLMAQLGEPFPAWWRHLVESDGARAAARQMARILRALLELGRDECIARVTAAMLTGESLSTALLVPLTSTAMSLSTVPDIFAIDIETSSVRAFDDLLLNAGAVGGVL